MGNIHTPAGTVTHTGKRNPAANVRRLRSSRGETSGPQYKTKPPALQFRPRAYMSI